MPSLRHAPRPFRPRRLVAATAQALFPIAGPLVKRHLDNFDALQSDLPLMAPLGKNERVFVLSPHPDDECLGAGGLIYRARQAGLAVQIGFLSNGDGSRTTQISQVLRGKDEKTLPDIARYRQNEAIQAAATLGVGEENAIFFGFPDGGARPIWDGDYTAEAPFVSTFTGYERVEYERAFAPGSPYCRAALLENLALAFEEFAPTQVLTTHPRDTHPDHIVAYRACEAAIASLPATRRPKLLAFLIHCGIWPVPNGLHPDLPLMPPLHLLRGGTRWVSLPLSDAEIAAKKAALECHKTQMGFNAALPARFRAAQRNFWRNRMKYNASLLTCVLLGALLIPAHAQNDAPVTPTPATPTPAPLADGAPFDWQFHLKAGQKYRTTVDSSNKSSQHSPAPGPGGKMGSQEMNMAMTQHMVTELNVLSSDEKGAKVEMTYRDLKQNVRMVSAGKVLFDTSKPPTGKGKVGSTSSDALNQAMNGAKIGYTLSSRGKVSDVSGFEDYLKRVSNGVSTDQSPALKAQMRAMFDKMMSPAALEGLFKKNIGILPEKPVAPGESWTYKIELPMAFSMGMQFTGTRTFVSRSHGIAKIAEKSVFATNGAKKVQIPVPLPAGQAAPIFYMALSGQTTGETLVDEASGMALQSTTSQRISGKMTVKMTVAGPQGKKRVETFSSPLNALSESKSTTQVVGP